MDGLNNYNWCTLVYMNLVLYKIQSIEPNHIDLNLTTELNCLHNHAVPETCCGRSIPMRNSK